MRVLGTALVLTGAVVFIKQGQWLLLALMVLIEAVCIFGFHPTRKTGPQPPLHQVEMAPALPLMRLRRFGPVLSVISVLANLSGRGTKQKR